MKKILFAIWLCASVAISALAADENPVLIFLKNGQTHSLKSSELTKIELSKLSLDSIESEDYVTQEFHRLDGSCLRIALNEMDSVAFGNRTIVQPKTGVRRLTESEASSISKFSETRLEYASNGMQLRAGETIYYDAFTDVMPYGLCAYVKTVSTSNGVATAEIEYLDPAKVFDRYFTNEFNNATQNTRSNGYGIRVFHFELPKDLSSHGMTLEGETEVTIKATAENTVADFVKHYYHAEIELQVGVNVDMKLKSDELMDFDETSDPMFQFKIPVAGPISFGIEGKYFVDMLAELGVDMSVKGNYIARISWTRQNGENRFEKISAYDADKSDENNSSNTQIRTGMTLKGELFYGPELELSITPLFNVIGAGTDLRVGPDMNGELSIEVLSTLEKNGHTQELYKKGRIECSPLRFKASTFAYRLDVMSKEKVKYGLPFGADICFNKKQLDLFPEVKTRARKSKGGSWQSIPSTSQTTVDVASYTEKPIASPLEIGYKMVNTLTNDTICTSFNNNIIQPNEEKLQNFVDELPLSDAKMDHKDLKIIPVFKYGSFTIPYEPSNVQGDFAMSTLVSGMSNSTAMFVTGMTPVSSYTHGETTYVEGNILPVIERNSKFDKKQTLELMAGSLFPSLIGKWKTEIEGKSIEITFSDQKNGVYDGISFTYVPDSPLGGVTLKLENGVRIVFYLLNFDGTNLTVCDKKFVKRYVWRKVG